MGLREEGLRAFGAWESLSFRLRAGHAFSHGRAEDGYEWEHTESFVQGLKERGFNLLIAPFSKGFGIQAESDERERMRQLVRLCHKHGMYAGGYVRYTTFIPETMKREIPDCIERFAGRTAAGTFARYSTQYWRYIPCPSSSEYLDYFDQLISIGVQEVGLDCLHVDGLTLWPEPWACHCDRCKAGFRVWLEARYPTITARKARFGISDFDGMELPEWIINEFTGARMLAPNILTDPLMQEWLFFRCDLLGKIWQRIVHSARRCNPECVVQGNSSFYPNFNVAWHSATSINALARAGADGFFSEEGNVSELTLDGRLHGYFETFKKLRRLNCQTFAYNRESGTWKPFQNQEALKRSMAHQMAFNRDAVGVFCEDLFPGQWPGPVPEYMAFHRDRRDLFREMRHAHDVAIYYSEQTRALNSGTPIVTSLLTQDVMMRTHVPFGYLLAERAGDEMQMFRGVILPEVECLSEEEAGRIALYVKEGGGLLIVGANAGRYDEFRRCHRKQALMHQLGLEWSDDSSAFTVRVGQGRVAFLPKLIAPEGTPEELVQACYKESNPMFVLPHTDWHLARNAADLLKLLRWVCGGFSFETTVSDEVVVEFYRQETKRRHLLHFVNFHLEHEVRPFEIAVKGVSVRRCEAWTPDGVAPLLGLSLQAGSSVISVGGFHRYLVLGIES